MGAEGNDLQQINIIIYINYSINQNYCYIIILPAFGIISQVISAFSNKPVFGQNGPVNILCLPQQTICGKFNIFKDYQKIFNKNFLQNTNSVSYILYSFLVKIFVIYLNNPQITKAHSHLLVDKSVIDRHGLSMLVGISEAIRLLLVRINLN